MSERVPRTAPINNQGDGEVYTQYRQWPFNSTNMGASKENLPAEDAEERGYLGFIGDFPIETGDASEFYKSNSKTGVFLSKLNLFLWPKEERDKLATGYTHGYILTQFERTGGKGKHMGKYKPIRLYRYGKELIPKPYGYKNVDRMDDEALLNLVNLAGDYFKIEHDLPKKETIPSFLKWYKNYKNMMKDWSHPGDEEERV